MAAYDDLSPAFGVTSEITSPANPRVKTLVALRKRRDRDAQGVTLVEGFAELSLALDAGVEVRSLYWCPHLVADPAAAHALAARLVATRTEVVRLGATAFARASYRESPDGWLAVVPTPERRLDDLRLSNRPFVLVTESVEKPGNLGAMLRTADAAGVDAVIAASPVTDWGNPNVIRASKGTVFAVPVASATTEATIAWLRDKGLTIVVATPDADTLVTGLDLTGPLACVVGAEHAGVSPAWLTAAAQTAAIPMVGKVNSLNVSTSAAIVLFEAVRQRAVAPRPAVS